ncbi:large subunit ribosomal protein L18e [Pancytospora epiphaga]|nr:large subunit ribosomal protein L18e [Pancytospora epiphaga]
MAATRNLKIPYSAIGRRSEPRSANSNLRKLHEFFSKIVKASGENANIDLMKITKRLTMTNMNRPPVKVSKIAQELSGSGKVAVIVAKVLDDERLLHIPAMKVVALQWSRKAKAKIEANGGSVYTLDQFIKAAGSMDNIMLIKGDPAARKATKFFGPAPGEKHSTAYPRIIGKSKNKEKRLNVKKPVSYDIESSE